MAGFGESQTPTWEWTWPGAYYDFAYNSNNISGDTASSELSVGTRTYYIPMYLAGWFGSGAVTFDLYSWLTAKPGTSRRLIDRLRIPVADNNPTAGYLNCTS